MCAGAATYFSLPFEPAVVQVAMVCVFVFAAVRAVRHIDLPVLLRLICIVAAGTTAGALAGKAHTELRASPMLTRTLGPTMIEGWITNIEPGEKGPRLRIDVTAIGGEPSTALPPEVRRTHTLSLNVEPGRFVRCWGVLRPPPQPAVAGDYNFSRQAYFDGLGAVGYVQGRCRGGALSGERPGLDGVKTRIAQWRRALAIHVADKAGPEAGGFAAALTSGDRSFMNQDNVEALRNSGLAHLLAISGLHLGLVGGLVYFAVRRGLALWEWLALRYPVQKVAALAAIVATAAYMTLSGASISTQRAFIMAAVFFGAIVLDRSPLSLRSFAIAMILVVILEPQSVMSPGFQMSFAATGGLIASFEAWTRHRRLRGIYGGGIGMVLKSLVLTSVVGAAATAPFALYHFDRLAPWGLAANLLAMPIFTFISAPCAGLALVTVVLGVMNGFLGIFGMSLERIQDIAAWASNGGGEGFRLGRAMPDLTFVCLIVALAVACLVDGIWKRASLVGAIAGSAAGAFVLSPVQVVHVSASGDAFITVPEGLVERYVYGDGDGLSPLRFSDISTARDCREVVCRVPTRNGIVVIGASGGETTSCGDTLALISSREPATECADAPVWSFTAADAPVSLYATVTGSVKVSRPRCGHRPWTPCQEGEGSP